MNRQQRQLRSNMMYGISAQRTKWLASIKRGGTTHARVFAFSTHGGKEMALAHAQAWRDAIAAAHPPPSKQELAQQLRLNNTSGVAGVFLGKGKNGQPRRWVAHTQIAPGKVLSKSFGITKWGYEGAKDMAIAERKRQLERMEGYRVSHPAALDALSRIIEAYPPAYLPPKREYSETPGVRLEKNRNGQPQAWVAQTVRNGTRLSMRFSIRTYGPRVAKSLALEERQRQLYRLGENSSKTLYRSTANGTRGATAHISS